VIQFIDRQKSEGVAEYVCQIDSQDRTRELIGSEK
jgi:hypothetical protein